MPNSERREHVLVEGRLWLYAHPEADRSVVETLMLYTPPCLARVVHTKRPFVIVHMAQSLDGMVCTEIGNSKWIGNEANLTHAHRLRALVDGVLVGGNTIRQDRPRLDVRRVVGRNPARLLFSDSFEEMDKLSFVEGVRTILLRSSERKSDDERPGCETVCFEQRNGITDVPALLGKLHSMGIGSILVEGGPLTFKSLLAAGTVDWLQLHVAPVVFGSGKRVLDWPRIEHVDDAISLKHPFYTLMDDAMMVTASL
jgi:riboflavin-specific deaminase-like protein